MSEGIVFLDNLDIDFGEIATFIEGDLGEFKHFAEGEIP